MKLWEQFTDLPVATKSPSRTEATAVEIAGQGSAFLAKSEAGTPLVFVRQVPGGPSVTMAFSGVVLTPAISCTISMVGQASINGVFTQVECTAHGDEVQRLFISVVSAVLSQIDSAEDESIRHRLSLLNELFGSMATPPTRSVSGLWAELLLIAISESVAECVDAWHADPRSVHDFAFESCRLEVKSTQSQVRSHRFSAGQLSGAGAPVVIASLRVVHAGSGVSVDDLVTVIRRRLSARVRLIEKLDSVTIRTLGTDLDRALRRRFDIGASRETLAFFRSEDIPRLTGPFPDGVSHVSFRSLLPLKELTSGEVADIVGFAFNVDRHI